MQRVSGLEHMVVNPLDLGLCQRPFKLLPLLNESLQVPADQELHCQKVVLLVFKQAPQLHDVRIECEVLQLLEVLLSSGRCLSAILGILAHG